MVKESKPKVEVFDKLIDKSRTFSSTQVAKLLKRKSAIALNKELYDMNIQFRQNGNLMPYAHVNKEWYELKSTEYGGTQMRYTMNGVIEIGKMLGVLDVDVNDVI